MSSTVSNKQITTGIILSLVGWGVYLAIGATGYFVQPSMTNPLKSLIVLGFVALFLGLWTIVLRSRKAKPEHVATIPASGSADSGEPKVGDSEAASLQNSAKRNWNRAALASIATSVLGFALWGVAIASWKSVSLQTTTVLAWLAALSIMVAASFGMIALSDRSARRGKWLGLLGMFAFVFGLISFVSRMTP